MCALDEAEHLLAARAAFLLYSMLVTAAIVYLIWYVAPVHGNTSIFVYLGICSLIGSLSVMSVKARVHNDERNSLILECNCPFMALSAKPPFMLITVSTRRVRAGRLHCFSLPTIVTASVFPDCLMS